MSSVSIQPEGSPSCQRPGPGPSTTAAFFFPHYCIKPEADASNPHPYNLPGCLLSFLLPQPFNIRCAMSTAAGTAWTGFSSQGCVLKTVAQCWSLASTDGCSILAYWKCSETKGGEWQSRASSACPCLQQHPECLRPSSATAAHRLQAYLYFSWLKSQEQRWEVSAFVFAVFGWVLGREGRPQPCPHPAPKMQLCILRSQWCGALNVL